MKLSAAAWISCSSGVLFSRPFLSRCLLYRLYDVNYSLLVHHKPTVSSSYEGMQNGVFSFTCVASEADAIHIHLAPSVRLKVTDLIKLPSIRLDLSKTSAGHRSLGEISIKVEPHLLPNKDMYIGGKERGSSFEQQIANTAYCVKGSRPAVNLGMGQEGERQCWKVSVMSAARNQSYGLDSARDWSLTAAQLDDDCPPSMEMCLANTS
jgi:hypothetical protein